MASKSNENKQRITLLITSKTFSKLLNWLDLSFPSCVWKIICSSSKDWFKQFGPDFKLRFLFFPQLELSLLAHFQVEQPAIPEIPSVQKICPSDDLMQK